jgi:hypothetical protein
VVPEHKLKIVHARTGKQIRPIGDATFRDEIGTDYFTLCFSSVWDPLLFNDFKDSDACLVIHEPEEVCERIHFEADKFLRGWAGVDGSVLYGGEHEFGPVFVKNWTYITQKEWRFAWLPPQKCQELRPLFIRIGSIERYAEILRKPA